MTITKANSLFCKKQKHLIEDQYVMDPSIKSIAWFSQIVRDEKLNIDAVNDALNKVEDFLDQKEYEKAQITAELQLAYAFQDDLENKKVELMKSVALKQQ